MVQPIFTLLTDFGTTDSYVAQIKGVMLSRCHDCTIVDITHDIPPQDVRCAARILAETVPRFPKNTTHLVVVDPGVGTERKILAVEIADQRLVLPDNGILTALLQIYKPQRVHRVANDQLWNTPVSPTFHGRDIIAPIATFLACGGAWEEVGPSVKELVRFEVSESTQRLSHDCWQCTKLGHDHFGNILLGSSPQLLEALVPGDLVKLSWREMPSRLVRVVSTYGDAVPNELVLLRDSQNRLELAVVNASALKALDLPPHGRVKISLVSAQ